jgi:hypothetical protein
MAGQLLEAHPEAGLMVRVTDQSLRLALRSGASLDRLHQAPAGALGSGHHFTRSAQ